MLGIKLMLLITHREYSERLLEFFSEHKVERVFAKLCSGTATDSMLDILGLESTEKVMLEAVVRDEQVKKLKEDLYSQLNVGVNGNGIAVFIPFDGIGGQSALNYLVGSEPIIKGETLNMENANKAVLIMSIVDKGYSEKLMDSAREAGATGGTVVRAKGTGAEIAKFFGVAISEEKEIVYIVSETKKRDEIMHAIMQSVGSGTKANGIVFSLPVDSVMGIRGLEN
jgi:nitrogen regulatory protein PII